MTEKSEGFPPNVTQIDRKKSDGQTAEVLKIKKGRVAQKRPDRELGNERSVIQINQPKIDDKEVARKIQAMREGEYDIPPGD